MAIKSSPEVIRGIQQDVRSTMHGIEQVSDGIRSAINKSSEWNDAKSNEYKDVMLRAAGLIEQPLGMLNESIPRLERLAEILDKYNSIHFH